MSALSQNWTTPLSFGRFGGRALFNGKPAGLNDEEHRLLLQILQDHAYCQVLFFSSGLDGDSEFLKSLAARREQSNRSAKSLPITEHTLLGTHELRGGGEFPTIIEIRRDAIKTESIQEDGYCRISGNPADDETLGKVRGCLLPDSPCLMIMTESVRESEVLPTLLSLTPSFGLGSMIAANHGRMDLNSLHYAFNTR